MRIAQLCGVAPPFGGDVTWAHEVAERLVQRGHKVVMASLRFGITEGWRPAYAANYEIVDMPVSWKTLTYSLKFVVSLIRKHDSIAFRSMLYIIRAQKRLRWAIARLIYLAHLYALCVDHKIDAILAHHANERGLSALIVGRLLDVPALIFVHGGAVFFDNPTSAQVRLVQWVLQHGNQFLFCSMNSWKRAQELGMNEDRAVYVGLGVSRIRVQRKRSKNDSFVIGFHGGLTRDRGLDNLIRAVAQLKVNGRIQVLISGSDVEGIWPDLEHLIYKLGLKEHVSYLGQLTYDQYLELLGDLDVLALVQNPGKTGSLATCLEAQSAGVPVVTTGEGGLDEYVSDGVTGVICGTGVMNIKRGLEIAYEKCRNAQWNVEEFDKWLLMHSWEQVTSNVENVLQKAVLTQRSGITRW